MANTQDIENGEAGVPVYLKLGASIAESTKQAKLQQAYERQKKDVSIGATISRSPIITQPYKGFTCEP